MGGSWISSSLDETLAFGRGLAELLQSGDIVLLDGPLGAGKTVIVRGVVEGLDPKVGSLVTSQSYVVAGQYPTTPIVNHLDLYRLSHVEEVIALGYEELLYGEGQIACVEWPALLLPLLEADDKALTLTLAFGEESDSRVITGRSSTPRLERAFSEAVDGLSKSLDKDRRFS
jgi:tRNA threonylcarbamoyladenosine biosynthesis protein TsaE